MLKDTTFTFSWWVQSLIQTWVSRYALGSAHFYDFSQWNEGKAIQAAETHVMYKRDFSCLCNKLCIVCVAQCEIKNMSVDLCFFLRQRTVTSYISDSCIKNNASLNTLATTVRLYGLTNNIFIYTYMNKHRFIYTFIIIHCTSLKPILPYFTKNVSWVIYVGLCVTLKFECDILRWMQYFFWARCCSV